MKKILTVAAAIIIAAGTSAFATETKTDRPVSGSTNYQLPFNILQVEDGIEIMLVESPERTLEIAGSDADVSKVDWKIKKGKMIVRSRGGSLKNKVKLIINVNSLNKLIVKGNSAVRSYDELHSSLIDIHLEGNSFVSVRNAGSINVFAEDGTETEVWRVNGKVNFN